MDRIDTLSQDEEARRLYEMREKARLDQLSLYNMMEKAKAEIKEAKEEANRAYHTGKIDVAKNLLSLGIDIVLIEKSTGLSRNEIIAPAPTAAANWRKTDSARRTKMLTTLS